MSAVKLAVCLVLCLVLVAVNSSRIPRASDKFTTKYDNINLDEILKSDRLLLTYTKCLLDKGKCSPDGAELKKNLPDALTNNCSKCSKKQKDGSDKVMRHLINKKPETYAELELKYDPTGHYKKKYEAELKAYKE